MLVLLLLTAARMLGVLLNDIVPVAPLYAPAPLYELLSLCGDRFFARFGSPIGDSSPTPDLDNASRLAFKLRLAFAVYSNTVVRYIYPKTDSTCQSELKSRVHLREKIPDGVAPTRAFKEARVFHGSHPLTS